MADLTPKELPTWCGGCGDFNILFTIKNALVELDADPANTLLVSGIGCGSKTPHFVKTYGFEGLHGRSLPVATGAKFANHKLDVIVVTGDGDGYGIGGNHLIHSMRRNLDLTHIVQNNEVYGLTKGQYSPTSPPGFKSPSTPQGAIEEPVNPVALGITMGATYVARGYAYEVNHLKQLIAGGIKHKGYALIDVFQPCSTYNKVNTIAWYKEHLYKLEEAGHDPKDKMQAMARAMEGGDKLPIGLFYKEEKPTYEAGLPQLNGVPLSKMDISNIDITPMLERFK
ncbi:MAG: 2-oxoacid:ferredoxin oxidoreductase subunit beta [Candidatus Aenigmarchaeota archaeon]|nr:2-oxoacid:ferredoxin oxidoreductase subunit beta [Candidatus Aenigmarchaeota archaeon]